MKLTGKASSYFYSWLHQRFNYEPLLNATSSSQWFNSLHPSMQWGILQDWADSVGIRIEVRPDYDDYLGYNRGFVPYVNTVPKWSSNDCFETRQEARNAAIAKLDELINNEK